jgi:hypothetical protein
VQPLTEEAHHDDGLAGKKAVGNAVFSAMVDAYPPIRTGKRVSSGAWQLKNCCTEEAGTQPLPDSYIA